MEEKFKLSKEEKDELKAKLREIAYNLWWSWNPPAKKLFKMIDEIIWKESKENPVVFLKNEEAIEKALENKKFVNTLNFTYSQFKKYLERITNYTVLFGDKNVIFFSAEYGLHQSLLIYAGGLGFLSGDILKESSDIGLPMIGIGFMYPQGYVRQKIREDGWQEDIFLNNSKDVMPAKKLEDEKGNWFKISIDYSQDERIYCGIWKVEIGKTTLFLLDTNIEENSPWNRDISSRLYVSDKELKLKQQFVLGFGGITLLKSLGKKLGILHINEDYPVFALLAQAVEFFKSGMSLKEALDAVGQISLFTTHTPLQTAVNIYPFYMVEEHLYFLKDLGIDLKKILELGVNPQNPSEGFNTTVMGMKIAKNINAVSKKHLETTKRIWKQLFDEFKNEEKKIDYVTNGVHVPSWLCAFIRKLLDKYLTPSWIDLIDDERVWQLIDDIPDEELWYAHMENKEKMINHIIDRAKDSWLKDKSHPTVILAEGIFLEPDILTICFARRMTGYKRPTLIFSDPQRLKKILANPLRPVQIIFAGKAHPSDLEGKKAIQTIFSFAKNPDFEGRIAFIEDYDEELAHYLVRGADVWLNNPLPPLEASGTSGMKAGINGVLNLSVSDGWWTEGYNGKNGWIFGQENPEIPREEIDKRHAEEIYSIIENEIAPLYYERDERGIPVRWVRKMKESIKSILPKFSSRRMLKEYIEKFYISMLKADLQKKNK
ncbi:Glycogen phosphorylase [bacterium HR19]|nr:Glycogen phosphorylase [bacterium HR19]